ncbi:hypothetical protein Dda_1229 [Drechslerella dactyloides]|uniref:Uncharacterized protein n=1 Tax=Drechslerella dactyloides TaxID=74499 RepID=A0AAD6NN97_DREDA|nr:hypothetical protein Dda_1229 [Drechslerella dactyloides]
MHLWSSVVTSAVTLIPLVSGHGLILNGIGCNKGQPYGPQGVALGVLIDTPRNDGGVIPFQRDVPVFRSTRMRDWNQESGRTLAGGAMSVKKLTLDALAKDQVASCIPGESFNMTFHQVNGDGNGPFECGIDYTGTGTGKFIKLIVDQQVPGDNPNLNAVVAKPFPLTVMLPPDMDCEGTYRGYKGYYCLIRCQNHARNGPFGGQIPCKEVRAPKTSRAAPAAAAPAAAAQKRAIVKRSRSLRRRSNLAKRCLSREQLRKVIEGEKVTPEQLIALLESDPDPSLIKAEKAAKNRPETKSEKAAKQAGKEINKEQKKKVEASTRQQKKEQWREWKKKKDEWQKKKNEAQEKGKGNKTGEQPQDKKTGEKPQDKKTGEKPQDKKTGEKPQDKKTGEKPQDKKTGEKPQDKKTGEKPQDKKTGEKPQPQPEEPESGPGGY